MTNTSEEAVLEPTSTGQSAGHEEQGETVRDGGADGPAKKPPRELGLMLFSAGVIGFVLPGPGIPALMAGGLILWPKAFGRVEGWFQQRFPDTHRAGRGQLDRFLTDMERRYPGST
jgi:hypothetical protein